jgi:hypothetical protein
MKLNKNQKNAVKLIPLAAVLSLVLMGASECEGGEDAPAPDSDSSQKYKDGSKVPVDDKVYAITGEVIGPVNETTRQVEPGKGEINGSLCGNYGSLNGSFTGPVEKGKGFVRIRVQKSSPSTDLAPVGDVTIIKTSDTKAKALLNGDIVQFKCRRQYEALAAVKDNEKFDKTKVETWELDYCRLSTPVITVK